MTARKITNKLTPIEALTLVAERIDKASGSPRFTAREHEALEAILALAKYAAEFQKCRNGIILNQPLTHTGNPADALHDTYGL